MESHANVGSPEEALSASLNKYGTVNLDYMREITDSTAEELLTALQGRIYYNPLVTGYEIKDRFIAGNVIEKAERIEAWMGENPESERMPEVKQALEALKDAEPPRIAFEDLDFNFGERWIPTGVYAAYMSRLFDTEVKIAYSASMDEFSVACGYRTMKITDEFLVKGYYRNYDGMHLLKHALHNTCPDMMKSIGKDEHGNDIKMRDSEGIQLANAKIDEIRNGFSEWLEEQSPQFKERLVTMYNRKFNCFVRPRYDGSHQTFPDLNLKGLASRGINDVEVHSLLREPRHVGTGFAVGRRPAGGDRAAVGAENHGHAGRIGVIEPHGLRQIGIVGHLDAVEGLLRRMRLVHERERRGVDVVRFGFFGSRCRADAEHAEQRAEREQEVFHIRKIG